MEEKARLFQSVIPSSVVHSYSTQSAMRTQQMRSRSYTSLINLVSSLVDNTHHKEVIIFMLCLNGCYITKLVNAKEPWIQKQKKYCLHLWARYIIASFTLSNLWQCACMHVCKMGRTRGWERALTNTERDRKTFNVWFCTRHNFLSFLLSKFCNDLPTSRRPCLVPFSILNTFQTRCSHYPMTAFDQNKKHFKF